MSVSRSYIERSLARFTTILQDSVFAEETAAQKGWLQKMDPRVKTAGFVLLILAAAFSRSLQAIAIIYLFGVLLAAGSKLFSLRFIRRVWIFMPLYTALIAMPALFLTPGDPVWTSNEFPLSITRQGIRAVFFLILRVAISVSFMLMLVLTTPWPALLKALRTLRVPRLIVFLLALTYRYIYVLLSTANSMFLARKSRKVGPDTWQSDYQWIGSLLSALLSKSYSLSSDVFLAMQSRGFRGEPALLASFRMRLSDFAWFVVFLALSGWSFYKGYWLQG